jgi:phage gp45-like
MMDLRRFDFDGTFEESGGQQFVSGRGMKGDAFTRVHRVEPHGFMSNPPAGSKGVVLSPHPDQSYVLGLEHPSHRPAGLPPGASALYDANGNIIKVVMGDGVVIDASGASIILRKGGNSYTLDASGHHFAGGGMWHDGVRIDKTHVHSGVVPGTGNSGAPAT